MIFVATENNLFFSVFDDVEYCNYFDKTSGWLPFTNTKLNANGTEDRNEYILCALFSFMIDVIDVMDGS